MKNLEKLGLTYFFGGLWAVEIGTSYQNFVVIAGSCFLIAAGAFYFYLSGK